MLSILSGTTTKSRAIPIRLETSVFGKEASIATGFQLFDSESELLVKVDCRWPQAGRFKKCPRIPQLDKLLTDYTHDHLADSLILQLGDNSYPV